MKIKATTYRERFTGEKVTRYLRHFSHDEPLPSAHSWVEYAMSDCPMGCKVYRNEVTGSLAVAHNSNYNCKR